MKGMTIIMKKTSVLLLLLILVALSAAACGDDARPNAAQDTNVDLDLSAFGTTIVHAELNNIMSSPSDYLGKTIRMRGPYYYGYLGETEQRYNFIAVEIADACCINGIEFIWDGDNAFPDGYPKETAMIEVTGVFSRYEDPDGIFYYLEADAVVVV